MRRSGFALIEFLVVVAIISALVATVMLNWPTLRADTQKATALSNLRNIGVAMKAYAADNEQALPRRVSTGDKWPKLLSQYLDSPQPYAAVGDTNNFIVQRTDPLSNTRNNTSYIMNGFNDLGAFTDENVKVKVTEIAAPNQVILLGTPKSDSGQFYMDVLEGPRGNHVDLLNLRLYGEGSTYLFADGSVQYILAKDYNSRLWLVNKEFAMPASFSP